MVPHSVAFSLDMLIYFSFMVFILGCLLLYMIPKIELRFNNKEKNSKGRIVNIIKLLNDGTMKQIKSIKLLSVTIICTSISYFLKLAIVYFGFLAATNYLNFIQVVLVNLFYSLQG